MRQPVSQSKPGGVGQVRRVLTSALAATLISVTFIGGALNLERFLWFRVWESRMPDGGIYWVGVALVVIALVLETIATIALIRRRSDGAPLRVSETAAVAVNGVFLAALSLFVTAYGVVLYSVSGG